MLQDFSILLQCWLVHNRGGLDQVARPFGATFTVDGSWMQVQRPQKKHIQLGDCPKGSLTANAAAWGVLCWCHRCIRCWATGQKKGHTSCFLWDHGPVTSRVWSEAWTWKGQNIWKSWFSISLQWEDCETGDVHPRSLQGCRALQHKKSFDGLEVRLPVWASIQGHSIGGCCGHCTLQESRHLSSNAYTKKGERERNNLQDLVMPVQLVRHPLLKRHLVLSRSFLCFGQHACLGSSSSFQGPIRSCLMRKACKSCWHLPACWWIFAAEVEMWHMLTIARRPRPAWPAILGHRTCILAWPLALRLPTP